MELSLILSLMAVAILGGILGFWIASFLYKGYGSVEQEKIKELQSLLQQEKNNNGALTNNKSSLEAQLAVSNERIANMQQSLKEAKESQQQISDAMKNEMELLTSRILQQNSQQLIQKNEEKIGQILQPLQSELSGFKKAVEEAYQKESNERFSLSKEIDKLVQTSIRVSEEANNLTTALKGNVKTQGNWGEMVLETILENSGLIRDQHYLAQQYLRDTSGKVLKDEEGNMLQPDIMIVYPDKRRVIIDAKVSLLAWDRYVNAIDETERNKAWTEHLSSINRHIDILWKKKYGRYAGGLEYVLMFVPIESAFLESLKKDIELWKRAYDKNIMLVCPTNLMAILKIVAELWRMEKQNENAAEIANKAGLLYDKFYGFLENMEEIGKKIGEADKVYQQSFKQLYTGRGNLIGKVEELKKMGANASKQIPANLLREESDNSTLPNTSETA
ncbi:MAG: DNA recombination protein RmuC [Chitinophagia bacterium]|nr:DNA recombination protein RmuC [Chitinophagia bacterium]